MFAPLLFVAIPVFIIFIGTIAALSFSPENGVVAAESQSVVAEVPMDAVTSPQPGPIFFKPLSKSKTDIDLVIDDLSVADLLSLIEAHMKKESQAARAFSNNPSAHTLWLN